MTDSERIPSSTAWHEVDIRTMRPTFPVAGAMLLVVVSFALSLISSQFLLQRVDQRALAISQDAIPDIERLAAAQREMMRSVVLVNAYVEGSLFPRMDLRRAIDAGQARLLAQTSAHRSRSAFPQDLQLLRESERDIALLIHSETRALEEADAGAHEAASSTLSETMQSRVLSADRTLTQLRERDAIAIQSSVDHILQVRHAALRIATILGLVSLGIAIAATALVLHMLRTRARLIEAHGQLLADRATELEAFAGRVAHDLRDPLSSTTLLVESALRAPQLDPGFHQSLGKVRRQLERMRRVIDGLLDFARAGARPAPGCGADLAAVLEEVIASFRPAAEAARIELQVASVAAVRIASAPEALASILSNLLGNAIKYVREGTRLPHRISICASRINGCARIEIRDNGPGIPPRYEQSIFEPFRRLGATQPGIGLGLATVKRIIEIYEGRVGVSSELGRGSLFWVELPCSDASPADRAEGA
ncbi:MAG: HAMP domain-containing histidine kinase [Proteobacteria bacterium]|nr:HAMP domain-containing histidine kinase [Pseudomonadota bacterium]